MWRWHDLSFSPFKLDWVLNPFNAFARCWDPPRTSTCSFAQLWYLPPQPHLQHRRAIEFIPLLIGLGISGPLATSSAGIGVALDSYTKLSQQLIDDVNMIYQSVKDLQDQVDSLAEVVLQNRWSLDWLTADKGGTCLVLQEKCCFYANKSGIVSDRIGKHQQEFEMRHQELFDNPTWSAWDGILPFSLSWLSAWLTNTIARTFSF